MRQFIRLGLADVEVILDLVDGEIIVVELLHFVHDGILLVEMQSKSAMQVGTRIALYYKKEAPSAAALPKRGLARRLRNGYNTPVA